MNTLSATNPITKTPADYLAAVFLVLMASIPFINPEHYPPWYTYYAEGTSAVFGLGFSMVIWLMPDTRPQRSLTGLWLLFIAAAMFLQPIVMPLPYWLPALTGILQVVFAMLVVFAVSAWRERVGQDWILTALAIGLLFGAFVTGLIGWVQRLNLTSSSFFAGIVLVHPVDPRQAIGNIGQRNLYGHYLMWGNICAVYLFARCRQSPWRWLLALLMAWTAVDAALTESRTALGYYVTWAMLAFAGLFFGRSEEQRRFAVASIITIIFGVSIQFFGSYLAQQIAHMFGIEHMHAAAGVDRWEQAGAGFGRRVIEWKKAWMTFRAHPWFGVGFGYIAVPSFELQTLPQFVGDKEDVLWTHCHDVVLQMAAEMGVVGLAILGGLVGLLARALRRWQSVITPVVLSMAAVSIIHSMMEYPLWYVHYFMIFAVCLALAEGDTVPLLRQGWREVLAVASVVVMGICCVHARMYSEIMDRTRTPPSPDIATKDAEWLRISREYDPFFDYLADDALTNYRTDSTASMKEQLAVTDRLMRYRPFPDATLWRMCALGKAGRTAEALRLFAHAEAVYPGYSASFRRDLRRLSCLPLASLPPLLPEAPAEDEDQ